MKIAVKKRISITIFSADWYSVHGHWRWIFGGFFSKKKSSLVYGGNKKNPQGINNQNKFTRKKKIRDEFVK